MELQTTSHLLMLPRELRDLIYSHFLDLYESPVTRIWSEPGFQDLNIQTIEELEVECSECYRLHSPGTCPYPPDPRWQERIYGDCSRQQPDRLLCYENKMPTYHLLTFLQICSQLRVEFREFLSSPNVTKRNPNPLKNWKLEISTFGGRTFPTWLYTPLPPPYYGSLDTLEVQFYGPLVNPLWRRKVSWQIYRLLSDFYNHGPQLFFNPKLGSQPPLPTIENLNIQYSYWTPVGGTAIGPRHRRIVKFYENTAARTLISILHSVRTSGLVNGKINRFQVLYMGFYKDIEIPTEEVQTEDQPPEAGTQVSESEAAKVIPAGFKWGVLPYLRRDQICQCKEGAPDESDNSLLIVPGYRGHLHSEDSHPRDQLEEC